ncbi:unnamed protein product [Protopolystoma xenopodis]|uniref:Ion transport domain-containing protein n=1 Tax=Protopolystoma xenopodis TaxID=117903 RepID=A0A448XKW1_9PLAT|nr:unnamed protein product [Protopolystoma xenopodis]
MESCEDAELGAREAEFHLNPSEQKVEVVRSNFAESLEETQGSTLPAEEGSLLSLLGSVYFGYQVSLLSIALVTFVLSTVSQFRSPLPDNLDKAPDSSGVLAFPYTGSYHGTSGPAIWQTGAEKSMPPTSSSKELSFIPLYKGRMYHSGVFALTYAWIRNLDTVCCAALSLDLLARLVFCPDLINLLSSLYTWIDALSLLPSYVDLFVVHVVTKVSNTSAEPTGSPINGSGRAWRTSAIVSPHRDTFYQMLLASDYLNLLKVLVVLRYLRILRRHRGTLVLVYTIRTSMHDIFILLIMLAISTVFFGAAAYYTDDTFHSVADGTWWALVTMSTVGYGDRAPKTLPGTLVAVGCILTGLLLIAYIVPLLVNHFLLYYSHADQLNELAVLERRRRLQANKKTRYIDAREKQPDLALKTQVISACPLAQKPEDPVNEQKFSSLTKL